MGPDDIDPSLCTHLIYGFATLNPTTLLLRIDDRSTDINLSKIVLNITKTHNVGLLFYCLCSLIRQISNYVPLIHRVL